MTSLATRRRTVNHLVTVGVTLMFVLAAAVLLSVSVTVIINGSSRFDLELITSSMRNIIGAGGGVLHALMGTLLMTFAAALLSVPLGIAAAIYLVEYGGRFAGTLSFLVSVMTGTPSIIAGLFAYALFAAFLGPGVRLGIVGSVALSILMIPVVTRTSADMLRLVPRELREASAALGVPRWRTVLGVVLPTCRSGIVTGVMVAVARIIGETAPLLLAAGFTASLNLNLFQGRMSSLPVFVYTQYAHQGNPASAFLDRAWAAALLLILIVVGLHLVARLISRKGRYL